MTFVGVGLHPTEAAEIVLLCSRLCVLERMKVVRFLVSKNIKCLEHDGIRINIDAMREGDRGALLEFVKGLTPEPTILVD
jgi:hypothetical protein